jgi:hypothetical protein
VGPIVLIPPGGKVLWDALGTNPCLVADGSGGVVCAYGWRTAEGVRKLAVCRLAADGSVLWGAPQLRSVIGPGLCTFSAATLSTGPDGAATLWVGTPIPGRSFAHALLFQRLNADGLPAAGPTPTVVLSTEGGIRGIQTHGDGVQGAYVLCSFDAPRRGGGLVAARIGSDGQQLWPMPVPVRSAPWAGAHFACCSG